MRLSLPLTPCPYPCPHALAQTVLQRVHALVAAHISPVSPCISPTSRVQELVVAHANVPSNSSHWSSVLDGAG